MKVTLHKPQRALVQSLVSHYTVYEVDKAYGLKTLPNGMVDGWVTLQGGFAAFLPSKQAFVTMPQAGFFPPTDSFGLLQLFEGSLCIGIKLYPHCLAFPVLKPVAGSADPIDFDALFDPGLRLSLVEALQQPGADVVATLDTFLETHFGPQPADHAWMDAVLQYIQQSDLDVLTNGELASRFHVTERTFERRFKQVIGLTPRKYINILRLQHSIRHIRRRTGNRPAHGALSEALAIGYADQSHFIRECKALTGLAPRQLFSRLPELLTDLVMEDGK